jgi:hypothetical protein
MARLLNFYRLSGNSARTGRATRFGLGLLLPISLAPRVAARALKAGRMGCD